MSLPEVLLWQVLRGRPNGLKFRRQFPIAQMTADFACLECRLIVEIDGDAHNYGNRPQRDAARDAFLRREGFGILRIPAHEVLKDLEAVLHHIIENCLGSGPLHQPAAGPPPRSGEEL